MAQPTWIDLQCGPAAIFTGAVWLLWLIAVGASVSTWQQFSWPWLVIAAVAVIALRPGTGPALRNRRRLRIHADGSARLGELTGTWRPSWRANRAAILLAFTAGGKKEPLLVCAALNQADDFRHLLVWCRFPRRGTPLRSGVSE